MWRALFWEVERHRRGRRDRVEQRPASFAVVVVVDVDLAEERGRRVGAQDHVGLEGAHQSDERLA